jgi:hypothetical protein
MKVHMHVSVVAVLRRWCFVMTPMCQSLRACALMQKLLVDGRKTRYLNALFLKGPVARDFVRPF